MKKQWWTKRKIVLLSINLIVTILIILCGLAGLASGGGLFIYYLMIIGETVFIIFSLIVYYLSVIADAVGKMAKNCEKDNTD